MRMRICATATAVLFLIACFACSRSGRKTPPAGPGKTTFSSEFGYYTIPIPVAKDWALDSAGKEENKQDFIRRHSARGLWTFIFKPGVNTPQPDPDTGTPGMPKTGWDKFVRRFGPETAIIQVIWSSKGDADAESDLREAARLHKQTGTWIDGSEKEADVGGHKAFYGRYKADVDGLSMCGTFMVIHVNDRRYQIDFSYTGGFSAPDNTFEKIRQIRFTDGAEK